VLTERGRGILVWKVSNSHIAGERNGWAYRYCPTKKRVAEISAKLDMPARSVYRYLEILKEQKINSKCVFGLRFGTDFPAK